MKDGRLSVFIYGAGAVASCLADIFCRAGHSVCMASDKERARELCECGLIVKNPESEAIHEWNVEVLLDLPEHLFFDLIFIALPLNELPKKLPFLARNKSRNLVFCSNTAGNLDSFLSYIGKERVLFCLPACGGFKDGLEMNCLWGSGIERVLQPTVVGSAIGSKRASALQSIFCGLGIPCELSADIDGTLKAHALIISAISAALNAFDGDIFSLSNDKDAMDLLVLSVREGLSSLSSCGIQLPLHLKRWLHIPQSIIRHSWTTIFSLPAAEIALARPIYTRKTENIILRKQLSSILKGASGSCNSWLYLEPSLQHYLMGKS